MMIEHEKCIEKDVRLIRLRSAGFRALQSNKFLAEAKEIAIESARHGEKTGARYDTLFRKLGAIVVPSSLKRLELYLVSENNEHSPIGVASIVPSVSFIHGVEGQLVEGAEFDYVCVEGIDLPTQRGLVTTLRNASDLLLASMRADDTPKFRWQYDYNNNGTDEAAGPRVVRKRYKAYMSALPEEDKKLATLSTHSAFSRIEGIAALEVTGGGDAVGATKGQSGVLLFETK